MTDETRRLPSLEQYERLKAAAGKACARALSETHSLTARRPRSPRPHPGARASSLVVDAGSSRVG